MRHYPSAAEAAGRTFGEEEAKALAEVIASGKLNFTVGGTQTPALETEFAAMLGVDHAVACSSGTAALHLAVGAVDPAPGDEIITTPLTDFGTIIPILAQNAVPVFADVVWPRHTGERTHVSYGMNYRMTELQAAVARAQLPKLPGVVTARRRAGRRLADALRPLAGLAVPADLDRHALWLFPVVLDVDVAGADNRTYAAALTAEGVPVSAGYLAQPVYGYPALAERRLYGGSGFPFTSPPARTEFSYGP